MSTQNFDPTSLINAVLTAMFQNSQQQTQKKQEENDKFPFFGPVPPTPEPLPPQRTSRNTNPHTVISEDEKYIVSVLGLAFLKAYKKGILPHRLQRNFTINWDQIYGTPAGMFVDKILDNIHIILEGDEGLSYELYDDMFRE